MRDSKLTELETRILEHLQGGGTLTAPQASQAFGVSTYHAAGVLRRLHTLGRVKRSSEGQRYTYYIKGDNLGDLIIDMARGKKEGTAKRVVIERDTRTDDLRSLVYDMDQSLSLDIVEEGFIFAAKQAAIRADWKDAECQLINLKEHIQQKLNQVRNVLTEVKKEARRKK